MVCGECGAPSVLVVSEGGVEFQLCQACAMQKTQVAGLDRIAQSLRRRRRRDGKCPHCGTTADSAAQTGLVGCPLCYEAFADRLKQEVGLQPVERNADIW